MKESSYLISIKILSYMNAGAADADAGVGSASYFGYFLLLVAAILLIAIMLRGVKARNIKNIFNINSKAKNNNKLSPMSIFYERNPSFNAAEFKEMLAGLYEKTQAAWSLKDMSAYRSYFSDKYYEDILKQIDRMKELGKTNIIEGIEVVDVVLDGTKIIKGDEYIRARIKVKNLDYVIDDATKVVVSGNKDRPWLVEYAWNLKRKDNNGLKVDFGWEITAIDTISKSFAPRK